MLHLLRLPLRHNFPRRLLAPTSSFKRNITFPAPPRSIMDTLRNAGLTPSAKFDFKDVPDLSGRVAVVTGGSAGIGRSAVKALADGGARVIFLSNKEEHKDEAYDAWEKEIDTAKVEWKQVDLSDLKGTLEVAKVLANEERIDILMANAGLGVGKPFATADGLDAHLTINHLSQFLLVNRLLPVLRRTVSAHPPPPSARIVFQSSELHRAAKDSTTFSEAEFADTTLGPMRTYSRTKLAQILFAKGLVEKGKLGEKVKALSAHPGGVETDQQRQGEEAYGAAGKVGRQIVKPMMRSPDHGALCSVWCAVSPKIDETDSQGKYYNDPDTEGHETKQAGDDELLATLWTSSENLIRKHAGPDALISWTEGA